MMKSRLILLPALIFSALIHSAPYTITDLGVLTEEASFANAINVDGLVVGQFDGPRDEDGFIIYEFHGFSFDGTDFVDLGTFDPTIESASSSAAGVNDLGQIVGLASVNISTDPDIVSLRDQAFYYENGVMTDLGLPESIDSNASKAIGINNLGVITGFARVLRDPLEEVPAFFEEAAIIDPNAVGDKFTLLGTLVPDGSTVTGISSARASNTNGQIIGWSSTELDGAVSFVHAFYIDPFGTGEMIDMGTLGGNTSASTDINEAGVIVGRSQVEDEFFSRMAFKFDIANDTELVPLGTLNTEFPGSTANAINDNDQVVGFSKVGPPLDPALPIEQNHAVLFENGMLVDLNNQIDCPLGWVLITAKDINNSGQIVGSGSLNGETHGFLLTPDAAGGAAEECLDSVDPDDNSSSGGSLGFGLVILLLMGRMRVYRFRPF